MFCVLSSQMFSSVCTDNFYSLIAFLNWPCWSHPDSCYIAYSLLSLFGQKKINEILQEKLEEIKVVSDNLAVIFFSFLWFTSLNLYRQLWPQSPDECLMESLLWMLAWDKIKHILIRGWREWMPSDNKRAWMMEVLTLLDVKHVKMPLEDLKTPTIRIKDQTCFSVEICQTAVHSLGT